MTSKEQGLRLGRRQICRYARGDAEVEESECPGTVDWFTVESIGLEPSIHDRGVCKAIGRMQQDGFRAGRRGQLDLVAWKAWCRIDVHEDDRKFDGLERFAYSVGYEATDC